MELDSSEIDTSKPTSVYTPHGPRPQTLSVALPASLLHNSKRKLDLRTSLAGNISRALAVFSVDEIVIYDDGDGSPEESSTSNAQSQTPNSSSLTAFTHPGHFLRFLLSYQETPPFMRSRLFPVCEDLKSAGLLPSLDIPSHLRATDVCEFREGITTRNAKGGTYVDCGLTQQKLLRDVQIPPKTRVTVRLRVNEAGDEYEEGSEEGEAVAPETPRVEAGYYWGYSVREARSLSAVFTESGFDGGYDLSVGTSERGRDVTGVVEEVDQAQKQVGRGWMHMLIVFGGVKGLEDAAAHDEELKRVGVGRGNVSQLFDYWVNLLPGQGSRTVRTEEALWMGLMALRGVVDAR